MKRSYWILILIAAAGYYFWFVKAPDDTVVQVREEPMVTEEMMGEEEEGEMEEMMEEMMGEEPTEEMMIVIYDGESFVPSELTVPMGTTVTFMNKSAGDMRVASAMHPTHKVYPEFDQLSGSGTDTTYEFVFDSVGSWGYHNHLNPSVTGKIIVE